MRIKQTARMKHQYTMHTLSLSPNCLISCSLYNVIEQERIIFHLLILPCINKSYTIDLWGTNWIYECQKTSIEQGQDTEHQVEYPLCIGQKWSPKPGTVTSNTLNSTDSAQGRISHIRKLGTCLGWQLNRGGTPHQKKKRKKKLKKKVGNKLYSSATNPIAI